MKLLGHREVEAVVLSGIECSQELDRLLAAVLLCPDRLRSTQCEVADGPRAGLAPAELCDGGGKLAVESDLDALVRDSHECSVPLEWYSYERHLISFMMS